MSSWPRETSAFRLLVDSGKRSNTSASGMSLQNLPYKFRPKSQVVCPLNSIHCLREKPSLGIVQVHHDARKRWSSPSLATELDAGYQTRPRKRYQSTAGRLGYRALHSGRRIPGGTPSWSSPLHSDSRALAGADLLRDL